MVIIPGETAILQSYYWPYYCLWRHTMGSVCGSRIRWLCIKNNCLFIAVDWLRKPVRIAAFKVWKSTQTNKSQPKGYNGAYIIIHICWYHL